jgi:hypothetical protein
MCPGFFLSSGHSGKGKEIIADILFTSIREAVACRNGNNTQKNVIMCEIFIRKVVCA